MADKVLSQMAMFDFTAPVKTVMVFEDDSDDENWPSSNKKQKNDNSITKYSLHHEVDISSSSDEDIDIKEEIKIKDIVEHKDSVTADKRDKSSQGIPKQNEKEMSKPYQQNCTNSHTLANEENIVNGSTFDNRICSEQQKLHNDTLISSASNEKASEKAIPDQVNTVTSFTSSDQSNDIAIMSGYLKKLINTVSDNLLMVLEAYRLHVNEQNTNNQILLERSRIHFIQVKHHFFKLSFLVVETIFIPQIHSYTFARNFIECTVRIAKKKSMTYSYEEIEPFYLEMLDWTKAKARDFKKISLCYMTSKWAQLNNTSTEVTKQNVPNNNAHIQTLSMQSNNTHTEMAKEIIPNLNSHNKTLSRQSTSTPTDGTKQHVPKLNVYNQTLPMQSNHIPTEATKQQIPNFNTFSQTLSIQSNNMPTEVTKQHVPHLNGYNQTLSIQSNNMPTEVIKQHVPSLDGYNQTLSIQSNNMPTEVTKQHVPNLNGYNQTLSIQSNNMPIEVTKQCVPNLNGYNQMLSIQPNNMPTGVTKQHVPNLNGYNQTLSIQSNNMPTEVTKQNAPNLNAHNKTLSRNKNVNTTSGLQRNQKVSNQLLYQHSISELVRSSLPNYEDACNLQRSGVVGFEKNHHRYSSSSHACNNNLPNALLRGPTCLTNGPCTFQNSGRCNQTQDNNAIPRQNVTIPSTSPATSLNPNNHNISISPNNYYVLGTMY